MTRRTAGHTLLLAPRQFVNDVVLYCLAYAASKYRDLRLHGFIAESNHHHTNCTDAREDDETRSPLPKFFATFHRMVSAALNTNYGRGENLWRNGSYDNVEIHSQPSIEQQLLYLWTNPVKDGLVEKPEDWPGTRFLPEDFGRTIRVRKPEGAFFGGRRPAEYSLAGDDWRSELAREEAEARRLLSGNRKTSARPRRDRSKTPEYVELTISPPPGYEDWTIEDVRAHFRRLLDAQVERIHRRRLEGGKTQFMGRSRVLAQDPHARAGSTEPTFKINPRIACRGDTEKRIRVLEGLVRWRQSYRSAHEQIAVGKRVPFPQGTYKLGYYPCVLLRRARGPAVSPLLAA